MPPSVVAAVVIAGVYVALAVIGGIAQHDSSPVSLGLGVLVVVGLATGHALAWQWGRIIPFLVAALCGIAVLGLLHKGPAGTFAALVIGVPAALFLLLPIVLSAQSARIYFGLQCPRCQQLDGKAANFFFTKYRCADCGATWTR